ncbi:serine-rich adhesin for platelets-like isoform X4 [Bradysia coprophila]|uniref:serine-rich adhesin for platelets-like isoform X4 n=1 Tax=Bradysia coprophila TaxID=38358 RepID=UPI00187D78B2|nr:serine-rich adhesin for platelets-like isoform X4 [Bradysia coprophila]
MAVTRSHSLKQRETVDTGTTVKARQTTPQPTKKGKPKKKRNKTSARKATKTPKIGNGQVVAQQKDPSTDPELPLQMVSIPTDIVYKLNISKMQHFVVNEIKDEVDTSVDATLSQSSAHSIEQEPLQSDSTADSTKSIDSTLSAGEPVEKPLSADKMNVRFVMDLQDYGIPILERLGHSSPSPMNADSLTVIKEESQSHLETVGDNNLSELTSASPQGVNSQQMVYHSGDREIKMNVRSVMDLQDYGIPIVERYGHSSSSSMNVDSLTVIREESPSHLETVGDNAISQELTSTSPQEVDSEKNLTQMIEMDTRTKSELKHSHPNVREECPSPASTIIKGGYEDEYLMSTETVISKGLEDECTSSNTIIKSQSENERPSHVIIESELVDECPSPTRTIIKSNLVADCLSPDIIIITSESDDECECPSPAATIIKSEFEDECSRPTTSINMENGADGIKLIERQSLDECLSPTKTTIRSESEAECPSPAATIIKSESEDECSRPTDPVNAENGATDPRLREKKSFDKCPSPAATIIKSESEDECPSPAATIIKSESEDECSRPTSPVNAENGGTDQGLTQSQSFDECPSPAATIIKSESEDDCPSPAATIIKSESEDECSRPTSPVNAENVSSRNVRATEAVHNDSQDIFVDSELKTNQSTRCSGRSSLDNSLDRRASSSSLGALSSQKQRCGIDRRQKSFSKKQQTSNERCAATNSPTSSSKAFHRPSSFSDSRRSASTFESKRVFESDSGSEWDGESDSERVRLQRPKFERNKRPSSNAKKRMGYRWSDIRFSVTPEKKFMEIDTTDDSEPEYGWEDPRPPKRTCVEPKSTQELDPNLHEKMQIFIGKLSNEFDLDVIEQSRKKLFEAIDESIAVQSTKKLSELDLKIQKKKDDYVLNLFGTDEFESWDNDPALSNVEATNKFGPLKLPAAANASLLDKMTRKHWENGI